MSYDTDVLRGQAIRRFALETWLIPSRRVFPCLVEVVERETKNKFGCSYYRVKLVLLHHDHSNLVLAGLLEVYMLYCMYGDVATVA